MPRLSDYVSKYHDDWAWSLAVKGATNAEIADAFGISCRTFIRWCKANPSLDKSTREGKTIANAKVIKSLYERATGLMVEEKEESVVLDSEGNPKPVKIRKFTKKLAPDTMAIMYWLNNREKEDWRQRHEITGADGSPLVPPKIVVNFIDSEDEISEEEGADTV